MPELDIAVLPSAEQIRRKEFASVRRGYDPDQVRDYLYAVAEQLERVELDLHEAQSSAPSPPAPVTVRESAPTADPYEVFAKKMAGLLGTADTEAQRLVAEAKDEATRIVEDARAEADRVRLDAQAKAEEDRAEGERMLEAARAEAERALSGLAGRRETLMEELQTMQSRLLSAAKDLDVAIEDRPLDPSQNRPQDGPEDRPAPIAQGEPDAAESWAASDPVGDLGLSTMELDFDEDDA